MNKSKHIRLAKNGWKKYIYLNKVSVDMFEFDTYGWFLLGIAGFVLLYYFVCYLLKRKAEKQWLADAIVLVAILIFLISYFTPSLIFSKTTLIGANNAGHYAAADYFIKNVFPNPFGWYPGTLAGMPLLQFYFPLVFYLIAILSPILSQQVAFKIATVLGTFLLPLCMYISLRLVKLKFPVPAFAAILTLPFLFSMTNASWGGNILGVFSGEFSYNLSLALLVLYLGFVYKSVNERKYIICSAILLALISLSHVYCLLVAVAASFILLVKRFPKNIVTVFTITGTAALLASFWLVPLVTKMSYTATHIGRASVESLFEILPLSIIPTAILALLCLFFIKKGEDYSKIIYFFDTMLASAIFYAISITKIVNIRFLPFIQLLIAVPAAYFLSKIVKKLFRRDILTILILFVVFFLVSLNQHYIPSVINSQYRGFENREDWQTFENISEYLKGNLAQPRVFYETSNMINMLGSPYTFELLPIFSGRADLGGLYKESSLSAPSIDYAQSLISKDISLWRFPNYERSSLNFTRALPRLKLYNVNQIILTTKEAKKNAEATSEVFLETDFKGFSIYQIKNFSGGYVEALAVKPVLVKTSKPIRVGFNWFINDSKINVPVAFTNKITEDDRKYFDTINEDGSIENLPKAVFGSKCNVSENVSAERIDIKTDCIGRPLLIKISYFPNWKVIGANKIYYAAPSLMLIFPEKEHVILYYGKTIFDILGVVLSILGVVLLILLLIFSKKINYDKIAAKTKTFKNSPTQ